MQLSLPAPAPGVHAIGTLAHPPEDESGDDVLPNLLLDVREGFLGTFRSIFRQFGVTDQQFRVLSILNIAGDLEIGKLARRGRIVAPSMTGILDRMVEIGWVTRKASKGQRWGVVSLTAAGRRLIRQLQPLVDERLETFETTLGLEQLETLGDLLQRARTILRDLVLTSPETASTDEVRVPRRRGSSRKRGPRPKSRQPRV
jgi:homoprotocatechuate degradation regulator HpaR